MFTEKSATGTGVVSKTDVEQGSLIITLKFCVLVRPFTVAVTTYA
jgi:hypothetical protein